MHQASVVTEVVILLDADGQPVPRVIHLWDRLRARLLASSLDRKLASGRSADSSALLSLRARLLLAPAMRRTLAGAYARLAGPWSTPAPRSHLSIPSRPLGRAQDELEVLSHRLDTGPVDVRGVAQARVLLTDGAGPLYLPRSEDDLRVAALAVIDALDPWAP